jgi:hypothetical protein
MEKDQRLEASSARRTDFRRIAALAVLVFECLLVSFALSSTSRNQVSSTIATPRASSLLASTLPSTDATFDALDASRPLYPYSIIPGGIESSAELRNAMDHDPVVAEHYAKFNLARAQVVRLNENHAVYVSYRVGNRVFWTRKQLNLLKGETLITDGEHTARTRCGNQISEVPVAPVGALPEEAEVLAGPPVLVAENSPPPELPLTVPPASEIPPIAATPPGPGGGIFIPPSPPILGGGSTPTTPITPPPVPEPDELLMLAAGLAGIWVLARRRRFALLLARVIRK